jgi:hypothetical protein
MTPTLAGGAASAHAITRRRPRLAHDAGRPRISGNRVALEVAWSATLRVPLGTRAPGDTLRAHLAFFLEVAAGHIVRQRNHDGYAPF